MENKTFQEQYYKVVAEYGDALTGEFSSITDHAEAIMAAMKKMFDLAKMADMPSPGSFVARVSLIIWSRLYATCTGVGYNDVS